MPDKWQNVVPRDCPSLQEFRLNVRWLKERLQELEDWAAPTDVTAKEATLSTRWQNEEELPPMDPALVAHFGPCIGGPCFIPPVARHLKLDVPGVDWNAPLPEED